MHTARPTQIRVRVLSVVVTALTFALLAVSSASATTTVSVVPTTKVLKVAGGSETSDIRVSYAAGNFSVEDAGSTVAVSGTSCILVATYKATCFYGGLAPPSLLVTSGAGEDMATIEASVPNTITAVLTGVNYVRSDSAPLDATIDGDSYLPDVVGSPYPDRIVIAAPTACNAQVNGGAGDDEIHVDVDDRDLDGERICGPTYSSYSISGGDGDDLVDASASQTELRYVASEGHDVFMGGSGDDHITVGDGPDWAFGGGGNDRFYDNAGDDPAKLWGGPGNDTFTDWHGNITTPHPGSPPPMPGPDITYFDGGSGSDAIAYRTEVGEYDLNISLDGVANDGEAGENDNIRPSVELISDPFFYGETGQFGGNDVLTGSNAPNVIGGQVGDDTIDGLGGQDDLKGGPGADAITGGSGPDLIYGEADDDEIFAEDGEIDTIFCGSGTDVVHADVSDSVDGDCETVL